MSDDEKPSDESQDNELSVDNLLVEILELERQKLKLQLSKGSLNVNALQDRIKRLKFENRLSQDDQNGTFSERTKDSTSSKKVRNSMRSNSPVRIKTKRRSMMEYKPLDISRSSVRIKKMVTETQNDILPLATVSKFDDTLQQYLFNQKSAKNTKFLTARARRNTLGTAVSADASSTKSLGMIGYSTSPDLAFRSNTALIEKSPSSPHDDNYTDRPSQFSLDDVDTGRSTNFSLLSSARGDFHSPTMDFSKIYEPLIEDDKSHKSHDHDDDDDISPKHYESGSIINMKVMFDTTMKSSKHGSNSISGGGGGGGVISTMNTYDVSEFTPQIPGSFEFCILESDIQVLKAFSTVKDTTRSTASSAATSSSVPALPSLDMNLGPIHTYKTHTSTTTKSSYRILSSYFPSRVVSCYPSSLQYSPTISNISDFCFPSGSKIHICTPNSAYYYINPIHDRFHIMQFTDANHMTSYACCLIINMVKPILTHQNEGYNQDIYELYIQQYAARIIQKALKFFLKNIHQRITISPRVMYQKRLKELQTQQQHILQKHQFEQYHKSKPNYTPLIGMTHERLTAINHQIHSLMNNSSNNNNLSTNNTQGIQPSSSQLHFNSTNHLSSSASPTHMHSSATSPITSKQYKSPVPPLPTSHPPPPPQPETFFQKYFGNKNTNQTLFQKLGRVYEDIHMVMSTNTTDMPLQKVLELSTLVKKAKDEGYTIHNNNMIDKCDQLLQSYGVQISTSKEISSQETCMRLMSPPIHKVTSNASLDPHDDLPSRTLNTPVSDTRPLSQQSQQTHQYTEKNSSTYSTTSIGSLCKDEIDQHTHTDTISRLNSNDDSHTAHSHTDSYGNNTTVVPDTDASSGIPSEIYTSKSKSLHASKGTISENEEINTNRNTNNLSIDTSGHHQHEDEININHHTQDTRGISPQGAPDPSTISVTSPQSSNVIPTNSSTTSATTPATAAASVPAQVPVSTVSSSTKKLLESYQRALHGKLLVVQQAYCVITTSPHHALIFDILSKMVSADRQILDQETNMHNIAYPSNNNNNHNSIVASKPVTSLSSTNLEALTLNATASSSSNNTSPPTSYREILFNTLPVDSIVEKGVTEKTVLNTEHSSHDIITTTKNHTCTYSESLHKCSIKRNQYLEKIHRLFEKKAEIFLEKIPEIDEHEALYDQFDRHHEDIMNNGNTLREVNTPKSATHVRSHKSHQLYGLNYDHHYNNHFHTKQLLLLQDNNTLKSPHNMMLPPSSLLNRLHHSGSSSHIHVHTTSSNIISSVNEDKLHKSISTPQFNINENTSMPSENKNSTSNAMNGINPLNADKKKILTLQVPSSTNITENVTKNKEKLLNDKLSIAVEDYVAKFNLDPRIYPTNQEWTMGVLFACLQSNQIYKIMNLLLLEKSLIIVCKDAGIVTALTFAVTYLLAPFTWQGVFIPLVPDDVTEIYDAPVPFIVGTIGLNRNIQVSPQAIVLEVQCNMMTSSSLYHQQSIYHRQHHSHHPYDSTHYTADTSDHQYDTQSYRSQVKTFRSIPSGLTPRHPPSNKKSIHPTTSSTSNNNTHNNGIPLSSSNKIRRPSFSNIDTILQYENLYIPMISEFTSWFTQFPELSIDLPKDSPVEEILIRACKYFQIKQIYARRVYYKSSVGTGTCASGVPSRNHSPLQHFLYTHNLNTSTNTNNGHMIDTKDTNLVTNGQTSTEKYTYTTNMMHKYSPEKSAVQMNNNTTTTLLPSASSSSLYYSMHNIFQSQLNILLIKTMTPAEIRLVNSVIFTLQERNLRYTGDLCYDISWKQYVVRGNHNLDEEEFVPELFMDPIKRILEFQDALVKTQLFVGLVDRVRIEYKSLDKFRIFISDWIYFRYHMKRIYTQKSNEDNNSDCSSTS